MCSLMLRCCLSDAAEFKNLLADMGEPNDDATVEAAMKRLDTDNSGLIEWSEFKLWWSE